LKDPLILDGSGLAPSWLPEKRRASTRLRARVCPG
jgi:hypothetical protein